MQSGTPNKFFYLQMYELNQVLICYFNDEQNKTYPSTCESILDFETSILREFKNTSLSILV